MPFSSVNQSIRRPNGEPILLGKSCQSKRSGKGLLVVLTIRSNTARPFHFVRSFCLATRRCMIWILPSYRPQRPRAGAFRTPCVIVRCSSSAIRSMSCLKDWSTRNTKTPFSSRTLVEVNAGDTIPDQSHRSRSPGVSSKTIFAQLLPSGQNPTPPLPCRLSGTKRQNIEYKRPIRFNGAVA